MDVKKNDRAPEGVLHRRSFLRRVWALLGVAALAETIWLVAAFLRPGGARREGGEEPGTVVAGRIGDFPAGTVSAFPGGRFYLVRLEDGGFMALSRTCTHLGCTVPWVEEKRRFICPCHASAFDIRGEVVSPPAARALDTYPVRIEGETVKVETGEAVRRKRFRASQVVYPG
jgi:nitrite reductase/ring-hydroxylating ferredoxin subunit